ncbi:hypothetical protein NEOKW01_1260 [Nematocida sp. AWRm80]|nr:hypothetical protein NEOKW01_1260 [Nematocida sp. AWRm80]
MSSDWEFLKRPERKEKNTSAKEDKTIKISVFFGGTTKEFTLLPESTFEPIHSEYQNRFNTEIQLQYNNEILSKYTRIRAIVPSEEKVIKLTALPVTVPGDKYTIRYSTYQKITIQRETEKTISDLIQTIKRHLKELAPEITNFTLEFDGEPLDPNALINTILIDGDLIDVIKK